MLDGRFDPAFHQAFTAPTEHPVEVPVPAWGLVLILLAAIGYMVLLAPYQLPQMAS